jgi:small subunit ribosomal protein S17
MADETEETTEVPEAAAEDAAVTAGKADVTPAPEPAPVAAPTATSKAGPADDEGRPNRRKVREGVVVSDAMQSTVVVAVVERVRHARYGKTVQRTKKLYVHDAEDTAKVGDRVRVQETRPLSKLKRWRLTEVVERAR